MSTMEQVTVLEKYQPYPEYSNSKTAWIGDIPSTWSLKRVKHTFTIRKRIAGQLGFDILSVTQRGIVVKDIESGDGQLSMDYSKYQRVMPGDFAMNHMDLLTGYVDISAFNGVTSPDYRVFTINQKLYSPRYFLYLFQMGYQLKIFFHMGQGASHLGRWRLATDEFNDMVFPVPSPLEQRTIAAFLDYETARIDKLIAQQQRLIELLKEKRQAVISHAVTKGLNPDAPMKDSGVEWLGEVPEHWLVSSLKFIYKNLDYKRIPLSAEERGSKQGDYPYYGASGIIDSIDDYLFSTDHVLVGEDGANLVMRSTPIAFVATGQYWVNNHAHILRMNDGLNSYWAAVIENLDISPFVTGSAQPKLTAEALGNLIVAYPKTLQERIEIQEFINREKPKFTTLIDRAEHQVHFLKERRTALISAAVTGKIDLRGWTASIQEAAA
ncbi:restriction endonuclease subunit S [Citrobacter freundii]|uniref:restriction endonuclease subunit S n=1 Tax=Citrobacter freundii TaxID=546 RepID=UPI001BCAD6F7